MLHIHKWKLFSAGSIGRFLRSIGSSGLSLAQLYYDQRWKSNDIQGLNNFKETKKKKAQWNLEEVWGKQG